MKKIILILFIHISILSAFKNTEMNGYAVGDKVSDFSLKNIDGKYISLAQYKKAKGFIIVFTCNHCPFSQAYEQRIIELHQQYAKKGFPVIAINPNDKTRSPEDSYENMVLRAKEKKYPFVYVYDETQEIAKTYGATRTPHVYVLSRTNGENKVAYIGAIDNNSEEPKEVTEKYVANAIDALLEEKTITQQTTKAIGCTIKWKKN